MLRLPKHDNEEDEKEGPFDVSVKLKRPSLLQGPLLSAV